MPTDDGILGVVASNPRLLTVLGIAFVVGYVLKIAAQSSETIATLLGVFGKRWRAQGEKKSEKALAQRSIRDAQLNDFERQIEHFEERVAKLEDAAKVQDGRIAVMLRYLTYDAEWHAVNERRDVRGKDVRMTPHQTYDDFARENSESSA